MNVCPVEAEERIELHLFAIAKRSGWLSLFYLPFTPVNPGHNR